MIFILDITEFESCINKYLENLRQEEKENSTIERYETNFRRNVEEILNELEQNLKGKNDKDTNYYSIFIDNASNKETEQEFFHVLEEL